MTVPGPLAGVTVCDFTHILAGPYCTQLLADAGATVLKIEPPVGEYARVRGPKRPLPDGTLLSSYHVAVNRGKRGLTLDLKTPGGVDIARRLALASDVVVENFSPGTLARLGIDLAELRAENPRLVTVSITMFGGGAAADALAARGGMAIVAEAESGLTGTNVDDDGRPLPFSFPMGDLVTSWVAYGAIVTALLQRAASGTGCHRDIGMVPSLLTLNSTNITGHQNLALDGAASRDLRPVSAIRPPAYGVFPTRDGHVAIGVNTDPLFAAFAEAVGSPELADDPRFRCHTEREQHVDELNAVVIAWTSSRTARDVVDVLGPTGVPCGVVRSPGDVVYDDSFMRMGYLEQVGDGGGGTFSVVSNPLGYRTAGAMPAVGEHTRDVLRERLGLDDAAIDDLYTTGVFGRSPLADASPTGVA